MEKEKPVQGVAVYAEFTREGGGATTQVIVTPDGYTTHGELVHATVIRRTVTSHTPKKQWKFSRLVDSPETETGLKTVEGREAHAENRMRYAATLFDQLLRSNYTIVGTPILVEVSKKDCDSIYVSKTPTKMIYRISQCRTALRYPDDLLATAV